MEQHLKGVPRSLRGIEMLDNAVPRHGQPVFLEDEQIGFVTSGTKSPTLGIFCGFVLISRQKGLSFGDVVELRSTANGSGLNFDPSQASLGEIRGGRVKRLTTMN